MANWDRFEEGHEVDPRLANIPQCVREIVAGGLTAYLPLHLFAPEILAGEENARMATRPGETISVRIPTPHVSESDMDTDRYQMWSKRMLVAFDLLDVPATVIAMFQKHFNIVQTVEDFKEGWEIWRVYDMRRRGLVVGVRPPDIGLYSESLYRQAERAVRAKNEAEIKALAARVSNTRERRVLTSNVGASGSGGGGASAPARAKADPSKSAKYTRCLLCGSRAHTFDKDVTRPDCTALWLVFDTRRNSWATPDAHDFLCWLYNSVGGCTRHSCRFRSRGHRCSLCGEQHGCHSCTR